LNEDFSQKQIEAVLDEHRDIQYGKTNNRRVLGSMNDLTFQLKCHIKMDGGIKATNIPELNYKLNRTILSLNNYQRPIDMLRRKLEEINT
jgi:pentose-5-phosphate-3-epimerase